MPRRGENIRKRKDGRWEGRYICTYVDHKAKYSSVYGKTYAEVKEKLITKKAYPDIGTSRKITFKEILNLWLKTTSLKHKEQTYHKYQTLIDNHIVPHLGNERLDNLSILTINRFIAYKYSDGKLDGSGGLSASYIQTICYIINASLTFATENGFCDSWKSDIVRPPVKKNKVDVLSLTEQEILEKHIILQIDYKLLGILLSLCLGLRLGEVCGLKWTDFDFENNSVYIQRSIERVPDTNDGKNKTQLIITEPKTASSFRILPIPSHLRDLLIEMRDDNNEFVIPGKTHKYIDPRTLQYSYKKALRECQLREIHYHSLRHTFATRCIESGMDIKSLSEILGHSSVNITLNIYVHSSLEHKQKQIDNVFICGQ